MGRLANPHPLTEKERGRAIILAATSGDVAPDGNTFVVLYWQPVPGVIGYNLYRRQVGGRPPRRPLNKAPTRRVQTCDQLKTLIPEASKEWNMLASAFSGTTVRKTMKVVPHKQHQAHLTGILADPLGTMPVFEASRLSPNLVLQAISPCTALERGLSEEEQAAFDVLANLNLKLRMADGLAYMDRAVTPGVSYTYELRGVLESGEEAPWRAEVDIVAGTFLLPDPPEGVAADGGDRQVLVTWIRNLYATGFDVRRSTLPDGPYDLVNDDPVMYDVTKDLHGNDLAQPCPGFLDWQRWDNDGFPISHEVNGITLNGPENDTPYYYQVASRDILGRRGAWSASVPATLARSTPPMAPTDFRVAPNRSPMGLALTWRKVIRDINRHQILDTTQTYRIYRAETMDELEDMPTLSAHLVMTRSANPTDVTKPILSWIDTDPALVPPYGEKDYWYRLTCLDACNLVSDPSALLSGRVPDVRPPGPTKMVGSLGEDTQITVYWGPNIEEDLAGYQIYRTICDHGRPYRPKGDREKQMPCDFMLVGQVSVTEAKEQLAAENRIYFVDTSVPAGSPMCYAYWVRAYDLSGNLYMGDHGCPASKDEYVCQRLYEKVPPPVPIIAALKARNNGVLIEWISSPVQDLHAFHVYRSEEENDPPAFMGCVLTDGTVLPKKWTGMKPSCEDIPAEANPPAVRAHFLDDKVEPNHVYWYRVSALDWLGNESEGADLRRIPAINTFTYSTDLPAAPAVRSPSGGAVEGCGLEVRWDPPFDARTLTGFLVFRSTSATGPFKQVSGFVKGNGFLDRGALHGTDYWFRLQAVDLRGKTSEPSPAVKYRY